MSYRMNMTFEEFYHKFCIQLNRQQMEAVRAVKGPVLLLAVPGSGKTTVLVTRLGYMIYCCGIAPEKILTLTYTVAATYDMKERFRALFCRDERNTFLTDGGFPSEASMCDRIEFRTINGICARIIHYYGRQIGKPAFSLVSNEKSTAAMISAIYQKVEHSYATESELKGIATMITYIKNMMLTPDEIQALDSEVDFKISEIYKEYCTEMRNQGLMDYDDQMIYAYNILRRSPETLRYFQNCYPYICVDEAQDTSKIQHAIIALLAGRTENLFMVGDEDQSIYGFRAAYPEALLSFEQNHPNAKVLLMEENFRSNAKIVEAADRFIQRNTMRHEKRMKAVREAGAELKEIELRSRFGQYNYLLKVADGCQTQTAVLYRDNESILPLVDRLEREKIPYRMRNAELTFFTNRVVLDIQNIICFAEDPKNTELFMQIYYKISTYINKQTAIQICKISEKKNMDVLEAAIRYGNLTANLQRNCRNIQSSLKEMMSGNAEAAVTRIVQYLGYGDYLERAGMSDSKIFILKAIAKNEESPERLVDRLTELQSIIKEKENDPDCPFILSTIHASKGLEYDTVYLMDVADGIFPESVPENLKQADRKELENYEEERRLFYVGVTRAKNILCIFKLNQQSTFLRELLYKPGTKMQQSKTTTGAKNAGIITVQKPVKKQKKVWNQEDYNKFQNEIGEGVIVKHKKFGQGVVVEADGKFVVLQFGDIQKKCVLKTLYENDLLTV